MVLFFKRIVYLVYDCVSEEWLMRQILGENDSGKCYALIGVEQSISLSGQHNRRIVRQDWKRQRPKRFESEIVGVNKEERRRRMYPL